MAKSGFSNNSHPYAGYIIPKPVIDNFLMDYKTTRPINSVSSLGIIVMLAENEAMQRKYNIGHPKLCVVCPDHSTAH